MPAAPPTGAGTVRGRSEHRAGRPGGDHRLRSARFGKAVDLRPSRNIAPFADRVGQCHQIVLIGRGWQRAGMSNQFPPARGGNPPGMRDAQIPGVRLRDGGQRAHHGGGIRVHERQCRHRIMGAPGPAAATGNIHSVRLACSAASTAPDTRSETGAAEPLSNPRQAAATISGCPIPAAFGAARPAGGRLGTAGKCAVRCCRRRCPDGAAAPNGSIWRCSRPTRTSSDAGVTG